MLARNSNSNSNSNSNLNTQSSSISSATSVAEVPAVSLRYLKKEELLSRLQILVKSERKITAEITEYIKEIDRRRIYLDLGHTSLFNYLTKDLGYTPAAAQRRIDSARILNEIPELKAELKSGALNLTQVSMLAQCIRQKQKEMKANKEPAEKRELLNQISTEDKKQLLSQVRGQDISSTQKILAQSLNLEIKMHERKTQQRDESVRLELTLSKKQMENLTRVKELISHQNPNSTITETIDFLSKEYLKRKDPLLKADDKPSKITKEIKQDRSTGDLKEIKQDNSTRDLKEVKNRKENKEQDKINKNLREIKSSKEHECKQIQKQATSVTEVSKSTFSLKSNKPPVLDLNPGRDREYIPQALKTKIFKRDQHCQWRDPITKKPCDSKFQLQMDHIKPVWAGGVNSAENLQLLCSVHNNLKYKKQMGISLR